jgi:hypothetical protein
MKGIHLAFLICCLLSSSCKNGAGPSQQPLEVEVEGSVQYYTDTLVWIGGEGDPSGFILSNYRWHRGEPTFTHYRVYVKDSSLVPYISMNVLVQGTLDSIFAGGVETPRRKFPFVEAKNILVIR